MTHRCPSDIGDVAGRDMAGLILRHPATLDDHETTQRDHIRASCPDRDRVAGHVTRFVIMLTQLRGDDLDQWTARVQADDQPAQKSFAIGINRDYDAVRNGLTLTHNSVSFCGI